ncbi:MAG: deoxyguanosinetriphosphate triphosphohydrolase [Betaproteobacteria bacterium]|nr:deoxyguanosinetriphosphate triphosphohydrolase [Betaproteobacteria bacterium]
MEKFAPYAVTETVSRGRRHAEPPPRARGEFQRDRDRIIHSTAFRRLEYKTQVFINHEGDLFRTRLTHSLEVAQLSRSIARALGLNEDLVETVALAHDLGHTPFGHAGQDALNACMKAFGGFEHNLQSLRIVDTLEERYAAFDGLNLMFETREGILKHCSPANARALGELGRRFIEGMRPSLEAQIVNLADEMAYSNHDVDDGLRSELLSLEQLDTVTVFAQCRREVVARWPELAGRRLVHETIRCMVDALAFDLITRTRANIAQAGVETLDDVRAAPTLAEYSGEMSLRLRELKAFLFDNLYHHKRVLSMTGKAQRIIAELFAAYMAEPDRLPPQHRVRVKRSGAESGKARAVADYIAGMTDRFAMKEHRRLYGKSEVNALRGSELS